MSKALDFIGILFLARELTHRAHLVAKGEGSDAKHRALAEFYEGITNLADSFAEPWMGKNGQQEVPLIENDFPGDIVEVLEAQVNWIDENRGEITDYQPFQNIIDEISVFYWAKLYKLKNLR